MSVIIIFDPVEFRLRFPAFANPMVYPTVVLQRYWDMATCYISDLNYGWLHGKCRRLAIDLMLCHLLALNELIAAGQTPGLVNNATIDKVSVGLVPPPVKTQYQWWLSLTPYGQELLALLQVKSVGGFYIGGRPELSAFRKVGGRF